MESNMCASLESTAHMRVDRFNDPEGRVGRKQRWIWKHMILRSQCVLFAYMYPRKLPIKCRQTKVPPIEAFDLYIRKKHLPGRWFFETMMLVIKCKLYEGRRISEALI